MRYAKAALRQGRQDFRGVLGEKAGAIPAASTNPSLILLGFFSESKAGSGMIRLDSSWLRHHEGNPVSGVMSVLQDCESNLSYRPTIGLGRGA